MSFFVEKRDGRKESVHFDKITMRIEKLAYGLARNVRFIHPRVWIPIDGWFRVGVPHQLPSFLLFHFSLMYSPIIILF